MKHTQSIDTFFLFENLFKFKKFLLGLFRNTILDKIFAEINFDKKFLFSRVIIDKKNIYRVWPYMKVCASKIITLSTKKKLNKITKLQDKLVKGYSS